MEIHHVPRYLTSLTMMMMLVPDQSGLADGDPPGSQVPHLPHDDDDDDDDGS